MKKRVMLVLVFVTWLLVVGFLSYQAGQASVVHYR